MSYVVSEIVSSDGATISYREFGRGRGVVVLHGALESAYSHQHLAEALASDFTVYVPDRRGRGGSGPHGSDYGMRKEVDDLAVLLDKTGARNVCGISLGGLILLQSALTLPTIRKAAVYEPPPSICTPTSSAAGSDVRSDQELSAFQVAQALTAIIEGKGVVPGSSIGVPRWLLSGMKWQMRREGKQPDGPDDDLPLDALVPTIPFDVALLKEMSDSLDRFRNIATDVLLMGGGRSPASVKLVLDRLEQTLPQVRRVEIPGVGHRASSNADRGGSPELMARELRGFFA